MSVAQPALRPKQLQPSSGIWCNWQHDGLLIRSVWIRFPPALLATACSSVVKAASL